MLRAINVLRSLADCEGGGLSSVLRIFVVPISVCYVSLIPNVLRHIMCYVIWHDLHRRLQQGGRGAASALQGMHVCQMVL